MSGGSAACIRAAGASGSLRIKVSGLLTGSGDVVAIAGASDQNLIEADELSTSGGDVVRVTAGGVHLKARRIATSSGAAISFSGSGAGQSVFEAYEILSQSNWAVHYNASSAIVTIIGARIVSQFADEAGFALYIESSVSDVVKLANCVLIVTPTLPPGSIGATNASTRVHLLNGVAANKDKTSDITVLGTALTVSADFT